MRQGPTYSNSFSGLSGTVTTRQHCTHEGCGTAGYKILDQDMANVLLQIMRDLAPPATQQESSLQTRVCDLDHAAAQDRALQRDIEYGLAALDTLARRITGQRYIDLDERAIRRTLLTQLSEQSLMHRLGVRAPAYAGAAV